MSYDPKCHELAEHFLEGDEISDLNVKYLALEIQNTIENWIKFNLSKDGK